MLKSSKTISITIPEQLESFLSEKAKIIGISRSRLIGNILLEWQELHSHNQKVVKLNSKEGNNK